MTARLPLCALLAALAAGCGGGGAAHPAAGTTAAPAVAAVAAAPSGTAQIAKLLIAAPVLAQPGGATVAQLATSVRPGGGPTQLLVLGRHRLAGQDWLHVLLPSRPNGASGWVPRDDAGLTVTPWKIVVSIRDRRAFAVRDGRTVRSFPVVVGAPGTPTPVGRFAVSERIQLPDPGGFYGSWMLTLTAHSTHYDTFDGGDGRIALHGRGGSSLAVPVGTAASHGCVRLRNQDVAWLARFAVPGTPVIVAAGHVSA